jgi:hypothetical protein
MRGLFGLSDESRLILEKFLTIAPHQTVTASIDPEGRCVLTLENFGQEKPNKGIAR